MKTFIINPKLDENTLKSLEFSFHEYHFYNFHYKINSNCYSVNRIHDTSTEKILRHIGFLLVYQSSEKNVLSTYFVTTETMKKGECDFHRLKGQCLTLLYKMCHAKH